MFQFIIVIIVELIFSGGLSQKKTIDFYLDLPNLDVESSL